MAENTSSSDPAPTVHASAVLVEGGAVLIRGPGGAGKSRLALDLLRAADNGALRFARLVADDRTQLTAAHGRLLASPPPAWWSTSPQPMRIACPPPVASRPKLMVF